MREFTRYALIAAAFAVGLQLALVIGGFGFVTLLAGIEPVGDPDAGRFVGPWMVAVSTAAFAAVVLAIGLGAPERQRVRVWAGLLAGAAAFAGYVLAGGVLLGAIDGRLGEALAGVLAGPHGYVVLAAGCLVGVAYTAVLAARRNGRERPRWPWERDDEE